MKNALVSPHLSMHVGHDSQVTVVLQPRNADGTFRSPVVGFPFYPRTQHVAVYKAGHGVDIVLQATFR